MFVVVGWLVVCCSGDLRVVRVVFMRGFDRVVLDFGFAEFACGVFFVFVLVVCRFVWFDYFVVRFALWVLLC